MITHLRLMMQRMAMPSRGWMLLCVHAHAEGTQHQCECRHLRPMALASCIFLANHIVCERGTTLGVAAINRRLRKDASPVFKRLLTALPADGEAAGGSQP
jgi:hypothetical protein